MRLFLDYGHGSVELPVGETTVGRHVSCGLRFNDPFVSRRHIRILFGDDGAFVEEVSSRNGTLLNGEPLAARTLLRHDDIIRVGRRSLRVVLVDNNFVESSIEVTRPELGSTPWVGSIAGRASGNPRSDSPETLPPPAERTCPLCRARGPASNQVCGRCGQPYPPGPASATRRLDVADFETQLARPDDRRKGPRHSLDVPVVYTSDALAIDATTFDLSSGGVFIGSPLLDAVGTRCHVTLLPEAAPAIPIEGVVARVAQNPQGGELSGMGIRFESLSERASEWLDVVLHR